MTKKLPLQQYYYLAYENLYCPKFRFEDHLDFINSWKTLQGRFDLTVVSQEHVLVINDNEYGLSIHY